MKINWKLRLKNKATLTALAVTVIAFIYQVLAIFDVVPSISQDNITDLIMLVITVLSSLGIVVDPTTSGVSDSSQAMKYEEPKKQ